MFKHIYILISFFIITSCGNSSTETNKSLSSLIQPEFTYSQDFFDCTINSEYSLINLESFFSSFFLVFRIFKNPFFGLFFLKKATQKVYNENIRAPSIQSSVKLCGIYWHFLFLVWVVLFGLMINS